MGATPRDTSLIYALPQNSPQDCFDLRDALALISRHGRLRVPDGATAVKDYDGGNLYGTSVANLNGGADDDMDEQSEICLFSAFSAALISSKGIFSFETGFLPVLRISV